MKLSNVYGVFSTLHNLTETFCVKAKAPAAGEVFYRDRTLRGFALRCNWGGAKSFVLEGRVKGRVRRITLGRWPAVPVVKARKRALELKSTIADGGDPTAGPATEDTTFKNLADRYIDYVKVHGKKTWKENEATLNRHFKRWYGRRLEDITRDDVIRLHETIGTQRGHYAANRAITLLRSIFNLARDWQVFTGDNPAARIRLFKEQKRERFLSPDELQRVNAALLQEPEYARAFFPLVCMLGPRKGELLAAKWADVDLDQRIWRLPMTKAGRSHTLPLPAPAVAILAALPSRGASEWLFPGVGRTGHLASPRYAWDRIRQRAGVADCRIHDLRRTFGSWLAAAGYSGTLVGKALNHSSPASTAVYMRLALDPVRVMLEANAIAMFGPGHGLEKR